jgi:hypothetical protein
MVDCIAYRIQEIELGGLSLNARNRLYEIHNDMEVGRKPGFRAAKSITPGTTLTRKWAKQTHEVIVTGTHYFYRAVRYDTLSEIAAVITGMNWNGETFFQIG